MNMQNSRLYFVTSIILIVVTLSYILTAITYEKEIHNFQEEIIESNEYIEEYIQTMYYLKDEFVLNDINEKLIHKLDSISYIYFNTNKILDYNLYALDINYYQEQLRYNQLEKYNEEINGVVLPQMN